MAKKSYIAKHLVKLTVSPGKARTKTTSGTAPKVRDIEPGTKFLLEEAEGEKLIKLDAVSEDPGEPKAKRGRKAGAARKSDDKSDDKPDDKPDDKSDDKPDDVDSLV